VISKNSKIYVAGHLGMVGSAIVRKLKNEGFYNLILKTSKELDLRDQKKTSAFFVNEKPDFIIDAAAIVGGIWANNQYPYKFLMDNMLIQNNLIRAAVQNRVKNFIFLGSSCIYPKLASQPLNEEYLLQSSLEESNQWYAIAKISGVKLIEAVKKEFNYNYVAFMPTNLYGPNDNFDPMTSHVLPGMISKFHRAKFENQNSVVLWGDGSPKREFLHVDDLANAIYISLQTKLKYHLYNIGSDDEISILELSTLVAQIIGYKGKVIWDTTFPNGTPRKKLDSSRFNSLGWKPRIDLEKGIKDTYTKFKSSLSDY